MSLLAPSGAAALGPAWGPRSSAKVLIDRRGGVNVNKWLSMQIVQGLLTSGRIHRGNDHEEQGCVLELSAGSYSLAVARYVCGYAYDLGVRAVRTAGKKAGGRITKKTDVCFLKAQHCCLNFRPEVL
jgi:hypothetical protein